MQENKDAEAPVYDRSGYVGVDPCYQNYADETHMPILTDQERAFMAAHGLKTDEELDAGSVEVAVEVKVEDKDEVKSDSDADDETVTGTSEGSPSEDSTPAATVEPAKAASKTPSKAAKPAAPFTS